MDQYRDSLEAEQDLHKENLRECRAGRDDDDDDSVADGSDLLKGGDGNKNKKRNKWRTCIREENERHEAAVQRILEGRQQCIAGCHHQGGGSGR